MRLGETHDQTPASGSPSSYTFLPLAPDTNSRSSSNFAPSGRRSKRTTSDETAFLYTLAVFFNVLDVSIYDVDRKKEKGYGLTGTCGLYLVRLILLFFA
jgi:hypothetical protein